MAYHVEERIGRMTPPGPGERPVRYMCMPGSPYTGSTLLGLLLNSHPACASIGAATGLTARIDLATYLCSCGVRFRDCEFWRGIEARTAELGHHVAVFKNDYWSTHVRVSRRRWLDGILVRSLGSSLLNAVRDAVIWHGPVGRRLSEARLSTWSLARAVLDAARKSAFVDTARDHQRPKYLMGSPMFDVKVIHLVRDPRGNTASIMKHTGVGVASAARRWRHYNLETDRVRHLLPSGSWMLLHYEELCADPQATLDRIAGFIGIEPAPAPKDLQLVKNHIIGNSMRLRRVGEIREDRTWREILGPEDLRVIARIAGAASHRLGYDWP
jgi:Sulfotransferase family